MYIAKVLEDIQTGEKTWNKLKVGIFRIKSGWSLEEAKERANTGEDDSLLYPDQYQAAGLLKDEDLEMVGSYERNYHSLYKTFFPFVGQDGLWYALYSPNYTTTRVMSLPDCKDIAGDEPSAHGFCPVDFFVPYLDGNLLISEDGGETKLADGGLAFCPSAHLGKFGFVSGCVWGDDSSWKVQYLDLSQIASGKLERDARLGYLELPRNVDLREAVSFDGWSDRSQSIEFATRVNFCNTQDPAAVDCSGYGSSGWSKVKDQK